VRDEQSERMRKEESRRRRRKKKRRETRSRRGGGRGRKSHEVLIAHGRVLFEARDFQCVEEPMELSNHPKQVGR